MEEMRVYIANLGKYNEGELVGAWFEPPIDFDEVKERIGLNDQYEEYAIHDFELPFEIGEYTPIEHADDIILWSGCDTTADVAEQMLDEGLISDETLRRYFDSAQYGRDLSMEGDFVETKDGVFELVR